MPVIFKCPKDTENILTNIINIIRQNRQIISINPNLLFNKLIPEFNDASDDLNKEKFLEFYKEQVKNSMQNLLEKVEKDIKENYELISFELTVDGKLIVGLGGVHPYETSMTLDFLDGIPYIPGSAVKGVCKHYLIQKYFNEFKIKDNNLKEKFVSILENISEDDLKEIAKIKEVFKEINIEQIIELIKIFGSQKQLGKIIFFDAYPVGEIKLSLDVMTPHYQDYYKNRNIFPTDFQNPIPIKFLVVNDTKFKFYLGCKKNKIENKLLQTTKEYLESALKEYGIGAKTAVGYGYFKS